jgi:hypothetical protein
MTKPSRRNKMSLLTEAKDLNVYKKMLELFSEFLDAQPGTGMGKIYRDLLEAGLKCVPKDKRAQEILASLLTDNVPKSIQDLLNTNFCELPITLRPLYKSGNSKLVGFWKKGEKIYSKVFDMLDLAGEGKGSWCCEKGEKIDLLDLSKEG